MKKVLNGADPEIKELLHNLIENGLMKDVHIETSFFPRLNGKTTVTINLITTTGIYR